MSFNEDARNVRARSWKSLSTLDVTARLAEALRRSFGYGNAAAKRAATVAGSNTRTARNWLDGTNAPDGKHLILLMAECDEVLAEVLAMAGRADALDGARKAAALAEVKRALAAMGEGA